MPDPRIFTSSGTFQSRDLAAVLDEARAAGVTRLELASGLAHHPDARGVLRARGEGMRFLVHNYFPAPREPFVLNLASADAVVLEQSRAHCHRAIDLCADLGAPFFSVHAGFACDPPVHRLGMAFDAGVRRPRQQAYRTFLKSTRSLVAYGRRRSVRLLVENNVVAPFNAPRGENRLLLIADPEEMVQFAGDVSSDGFGYLVDVGHAKVSARTLGFDPRALLASIRPWVGGLHLSDNDGTSDSNEPFGADAWFLPFLKWWPEAAFTIESYRLSVQVLRTCERLVETHLA